MSHTSSKKVFCLALISICIVFSTASSSLAIQTKVDSTSENIHAFLIGVEKAKHLVSESPKTVFVDVRPGNAFQITHIPGSLNLALHHIKTKTYLKDLNLILVNSGFSIENLKKEAQNLTGKGFSVQILAGGLASWVQQGEKLSGRQPATNDFHIISSFDFLAEVNTSSPQSIDVFVVSEHAEDYDQFSRITGNVTSMKVVEHIKDINHQTTDIKKRYAPIVICPAQSGDIAIPVELQTDSNRTIFIIENGLEGLKKAREAIAAIQKPKELRTQTLEPCSACPSPETETTSITNQ